MSVVRHASFVDIQPNGCQYILDCDGEPKALRRAFQALHAVAIFSFDGPRVRAVIRAVRGLTQPERADKVINYLNHNLVLTQSLHYSAEGFALHSKVVVSALVMPSSEDFTTLKNHHHVTNVRRLGTNSLEVAFHRTVAEQDAKRIVNRLLLY
jgi:hypothetical protein